MLWIILLIAFFATVFLVLALAKLLQREKSRVGQRLQEITKIELTESDEENELNKPFSARVLKPLFLKAGEKIASLTPKGIKQDIERKIIYAGNPYDLNFNRLVSLQLLSALVVALLAVIFVSVMGLPWERSFLVIILLVLFGFMFPILALNSSVAKRQLEIRRNLPDILDFLLVSVEAGLGFDMALKRVAEQAPGRLTQEFSRALEEIRMGKAREEALRGIVKRTGVQDLSSFVTAVIQSEQLGSNIANTLRIQAASMRMKRKQRAEESAMKAPIKMLFPMLFFIFPTLLLVILGPTMITIFEFFAEGTF